jgi:hypothetical protein
MVVALVDAGDFESEALRGKLEEAVQSGGVAAGFQVQAHGESAPGWVTLSASNLGL